MDIREIYNKTPINNTDDPYFWMLVLKVQAFEAEEALWKGDLEHLRKEFVDAFLVVLDGLRSMGFDPETLIKQRIEDNSKKNLSKRNVDYYEDKLEQLKKEIQWRE